MSARTRGASRLISSSSKRPFTDTICRSCRADLFRRSLATAAAVASKESEPQLTIVPPVTQNASPAQAWRMQVSPVLSRPPVITRTLTPFEKAYYLYQKRLNERLALPFTRYFYFKKDTPADHEWKRKAKLRPTAARDIGNYSGYGEWAWNDELLVGAKESEPEEQTEALLKDAEVPETASAEEMARREFVERPMPRVTEADKAGDTRSLNRLLERTLYLVVKSKSGRWLFPDGSLEAWESLHQAAERVLVQTAGINMNTWVVGNAPIGHYQWQHRGDGLDAETNTEYLGAKVFFMKARIMAGQASLQGNQFGATDFQWLAKEELQPLVTKQYWSAIHNMLPER